MADYTAVTELPGYGASHEQLERLYQRYHFAYQFCKGRDVLEVACGAGQGLGYLAGTARSVVGGDIDNNNLTFAREQYRENGKIRLEILDAQKMPFEDGSFDVVILYEAIYYLQNAEEFIAEACRITRNDGLLIICTVNKEWADFNPSPLSIKYFTGLELMSLLKRSFPRAELYGGFSTEMRGSKDAVISVIKRAAVKLRLMPRTMKGKELFKRLFFGKLRPLPREVKENMTEYLKPVPIEPDVPNGSYKVIFAVAHKKE